MKKDSILGFLNVNKPIGRTSNAIVQEINKTLKRKIKVGHTGTLDPLAEGVMILCLGACTKLSSNFLKEDKSYQALLKFGISTDSFDSTGKVISTKLVQFTEDDLKHTIQSYHGKIEQTVPSFSAIRVQGERLYKRAHRGETVDNLPVRTVNIHNISLLNCNLSPDVNEAVIDVSCSSGTYIRSLVNDIGNDLECGAHLTGLRRTSVGDFKLEDSHELDSLDSIQAIRNALISPEDALKDAPIITLPPLRILILLQSRTITLPKKETKGKPFVRIYDNFGKYIGIASARPIGISSALKLVVTNPSAELVKE